MQLTSWRFAVVTCQSWLLYHNSIMSAYELFSHPSYSSWSSSLLPHIAKVRIRKLATYNVYHLKTKPFIQFSAPPDYLGFSKEVSSPSTCPL